MSVFSDALIGYLKTLRELEIKNTRFKLEQRAPEVGEYALLYEENHCWYVRRTSQNFYHSYGLKKGLMMKVREDDVCMTFAVDSTEKPENAMKTTADALKWAIGVISANRIDFSNDFYEANQFTKAKEILARAEFAESDAAPNYTVDGGFTPEKAE